MPEITEKELSAIKDILSEEELLVKKFKMLAGHATNKEVATQMENIAAKHQGHLNSIYEQLR
ncbi:MAG: hypothetical protein ACI39H_00275 [Lachnospiraceae bacterium]